ncbi:MAG: histidinol-phosphate transaminase, partial [Clostridia bacterium]|nr:histidinol-phosphate transaminase [Clostridia bacterium]
DLRLYPDPECTELRDKFAEVLGCGLTRDNIFVGNGSDEVLYLAFNAYKKNGFAFPDITYGFYPVYGEITGAEYKEIPLKEDYTVDVDALIAQKGIVVIANPNAPTGIMLDKKEIIRLIESNPDRIIVVDEAYVDFGGDSCVELVKKYKNLLVTQTFSKSRSLAGARLGFGIADKEIIRDLNLLKYSLNPYNINRATLALGIGALSDEEYTAENCKKIISAREYTRAELVKSGFTVLDSRANFLFAAHKEIPGKEIYEKLKSKKILVRYFDKDRLRPFVRITIGSMQQMEKLIEEIKNITEEI